MLPDYRNQILLLEPRDDQVNHRTNPDLLSAAKRYTAAVSLARIARTAERRDCYEKTSTRERKLLLDTLRQGGLVYVRVEHSASRAQSYGNVDAVVGARPEEFIL